MHRNVNLSRWGLGDRLASHPMSRVLMKALNQGGLIALEDRRRFWT